MEASVGDEGSFICLEHGAFTLIIDADPRKTSETKRRRKNMSKIVDLKSRSGGAGGKQGGIQKTTLGKMLLT